MTYTMEIQINYVLGMVIVGRFRVRITSKRHQLTELVFSFPFYMLLSNKHSQALASDDHLHSYLSLKVHKMTSRVSSIT